MEKALPVEIEELGILNGRDCIYLDMVKQNDREQMIFTGDINGHLVSRKMGRCPQVFSDLIKIKQLDSRKINRANGMESVNQCSWLVIKEGDFSLIGEMKNLQSLRLNSLIIDDFSFLTKCKNLRRLDLTDTNFTDCCLLAELPSLEYISLPQSKTLKNIHILEHLSYYGTSNVRNVTVQFLKDATPPLWEGFAATEGEEDNWIGLDTKTRKRMGEQLRDAISQEKVSSLFLSFEPWGEAHFLSAEFAGGWAAMFYDDCDEQIYYNPYNANYKTVELLAPVEIGGQTPVPKMFALNDMELAAEIAVYFLETGQFLHGTQWVQGS